MKRELIRGIALTLRAAAVVCAIALIAGCSRGPAIRIRPESTGPVRDATRDQLLALIDLQFGGLETLQTQISGVFIWEASTETGETIMESMDLGRSDLLFSRRPNEPKAVRLVGGVQHRAGGVFSALGRDRNFWVRLPWRPGLAFTGSVESTSRRPRVNTTIRPQDISSLLFFDDIAPLESDRMYISFLETWPRIYILHILKTDRFPGEILHSRIWFDRSDLSVIAHQLFDSDGSVVAEARYGGFSTIPLERTGRALDADRDTVRIPSEVMIFWPKDRVVLNMNIRAGRVNSPIDERTFQPPDPSRIQYRDIQSQPGTP